MSDNGPAVNNGTLTDEDRRIRYVSGLKGHKGNIWENGVKSPLFIRWEGHYKPTIIETIRFKVYSNIKMCIFIT